MEQNPEKTQLEWKKDSFFFDLVHLVFFADSQEVGCPVISHMLQY
jgi:hypothetical protein